MSWPKLPSPKAFRRVLTGQWALILVLSACADRGPGGAPDDPPQSPLAISLAELRSADYPADLLDRTMVRLTDGVFPPADSSGEPLASLVLHEPVAISDPGGEVARAAAVVRESGGGTGMFSWLHLLERKTGPPRVVASAYLGDRVDLVELALVGDTIVVRLVTQGPTDPLCCPTLEEVKRFVRLGDKLVAVSSEK